MRKRSFLVFLAAAAAAPALAAGDTDRGDRHQRAEPTDRSERRSQSDADEQQKQSERRQQAARRFERARANEQGASETIRNRVNEQGASETIRERLIQRQQAHDGARSGGEESQPSSSWRPRERRVRTIPDVQPQVAGQGGSDVSRSLEQGRRRDYRDGNYRRWSASHWRGDSRYDWRRYRDRNRSLFRLGFYQDPFGWRYRRWSTGSYLYPSYYGSQYWLDDPWHYRLPPAYAPYRWVRYWNDAFLVNIHTGQVVDVLHNFFW